MKKNQIKINDWWAIADDLTILSARTITFNEVGMMIEWFGPKFIAMVRRQIL